MPKIRRADLPATLFRHLLDRVRERHVSATQLGEFADWLNGKPEVPAEKWFKRFGDMAVCGEGELVKTFLIAGQVPIGIEVF